MGIPRVTPANTLYELVRNTAVYHNFLDFFATSFLTPRSCHQDR